MSIIKSALNSIKHARKQVRLAQQQWSSTPTESIDIGELNMSYEDLRSRIDTALAAKTPPDQLKPLAGELKEISDAAGRISADKAAQGGGPGQSQKIIQDIQQRLRGPWKSIRI